MYAIPVLMLTQDQALWQHWQQITTTQWMPARGETLADLERWKQQGRLLVLLDANLPQLPHWDDQRWSSLLDNARVILTSARPSDEVGRQALARGAFGYAHAYSTPATLENILDSVSKGNIWMGRSLLQRLLRDVDSRLPEASADWAKELSPREQEVARYAAIGESNAEIAERLAITERTVRAHISGVFEKLKVQDRLMLALRVHGVKQPDRLSERML